MSLEEIKELDPMVASLSGGDLSRARYLMEIRFQYNIVQPAVLDVAKSMTFQAVMDLYVSPAFGSFKPIQQLFIGEMISVAGPSNGYSPEQINKFLGN